MSADKPQAHQIVTKWFNNLKPQLPKRKSKGNVQTDTTSRIAFCPFCGAVLGSSFSGVGQCLACHNEIVLSAAIEAERPSPDKTITPGDGPQMKGFEQAILSYARIGYYVVRQTQDFVEMRKPPRFSLRWAAAWFIGTIPFAGLGLVGYAVWHIAKREATVVIFVDKDGQARIEQTNS
ncbi:MAG: hypothetical protein IH870_04125 [Chloroflexi bacterium]|nr:hypothetical protein [Chloroflexota bacterium]